MGGQARIPYVFLNRYIPAMILALALLALLAACGGKGGGY
jgi:hypothetical protein